MKLAGCFLLLCGWLIVLAALLVLGRSGDRLSFVTAGLAIEVVGWILLAQSYAAAQRDHLKEGSMQEDQV